MSDPTQHVEHGFQDRIDHRAAAEQALTDSGGHHNPSIPLMRGLVHALLALGDEEGKLP